MTHLELGAVGLAVLPLALAPVLASPAPHAGRATVGAGPGLEGRFHRSAEHS